VVLRELVRAVDFLQRAAPEDRACDPRKVVEAMRNA
jgi:hypothetical protein